MQAFKTLATLALAALALGIALPAHAEERRLPVPISPPSPAISPPPIHAFGECHSVCQDECRAIGTSRPFFCPPKPVTYNCPEQDPAQPNCRVPR